MGTARIKGLPRLHAPAFPSKVAFVPLQNGEELYVFAEDLKRQIPLIRNDKTRNRRYAGIRAQPQTRRQIEF